MSVVFKLKTKSFFVFFYGFFLILLSLYKYYSFSDYYSFGSDLWIYENDFYNAKFDLSLVYSPLYYFLSSAISALGFDFEIFRASLFFLFYMSVLRQLYVFSNSHALIALLLLLFLFYPTYISLSSLVLRQGLGLAFLMAIGFWGKSYSFKKRVFFVVIAAFSHLSLLFYLLPLYLSHKILKFRLVLCLWMFVVFAYILDVGLMIKGGLTFFLSLLGLPYVKYALIEVDYKLGFNINFLLPSMIVLLFIVLAKLRCQIFSFQLLYLLRFFFFSNGIALLFSGFSYYDRLMIYSWALLPFIVLSLISALRVYKKM